MCVSVYGRVLMCADAHGDQKKVSDPPKLEFTDFWKLWHGCWDLVL